MFRRGTKLSSEHEHLVQLAQFIVEEKRNALTMTCYIRHVSAT